VAAQTDLVTGWLSGDSVSGRPVDVIFGRDGALYVSDDRADAVYRITRD
jgi:glucose/arabinose dehydrogenase